MEMLNLAVTSESSAQLSKTVNKIIEALDKLDMQSKSNEYELEYSRLINSTILK